jgi:hypothetical protein
LCKLYRLPPHKIQYIIRARQIQAIGKAGNVWLYDEAAARRIGSELERIAAQKRGGIR